MATNRLTSSLRQHIVNKASDSLFVAELDAISTLKKEFGDRFYDKHVATPEQVKIMSQLPREFFGLDDSVYCYIGKGVHSTSVPFSCAKRIPLFANRSYPEFQDVAMQEEWDAITAKKTTLQNAKDEIVQKISGVVNSVNTVSKLLEVWPESKQFIPAEAFSTGLPNLPALVVANLTSAMIQAGVQFAEHA